MYHLGLIFFDTCNYLWRYSAKKKEILLKMGVIPDLIFNMNMLTMLKYNTPNGIIGPMKVGPLEYGTGDFEHPLMPKQLK